MKVRTKDVVEEPKVYKDAHDLCLRDNDISRIGARLKAMGKMMVNFPSHAGNQNPKEN